MSFDKEKFAHLVTKAKGNRSINKYGIETGVDPGYISRLMRKLIDSPPSPSVIKKLTDKSHNDISYEELMATAGYLEDYRNNSIAPNFDTSHLPILERIFFDGFLEASQEEKEELIRYWHEEVKKKKKS
ncbi:hypothetical protein NDS46_31825 (plasmid) [Paenibacillus thiaminolyticus]|uniref:hypothetical protein n=1 Tax=Paenibacillus thiaminolyticus TaxID=49283 RepID=UPI00232E1C20|nr:hypothetical protein [Paenibacillus thiaminolyticus]WCF11548.1 hypothetical protein NDS46_31825 [Paenibacillus thiaminolyticus]